MTFSLRSNSIELTGNTGQNGGAARHVKIFTVTIVRVFEFVGVRQLFRIGLGNFIQIIVQLKLSNAMASTKSVVRRQRFLLEFQLIGGETVD